MIAAATTKSPKLDLDAPVAVIGAEEALPRYSITALYWRTLLFMCLLSAPLFFFGVKEQMSPAAVFWYIALLLPAIQLGTSLVLAVWMMAQRRRRVGHDQRMRHLGRITLRGFIGGLIGVAVMLVIGLSL